MRPTTMLAAGVVGVGMLLLGSAAFGSDVASGPASPTTAGATDRPLVTVVQRQRRGRRPRCRGVCRWLRVGQGSDGQSTCGPPRLVDRSSAAASDVLRFAWDSFFFTTTAGDLLLAAVVTEGAGITPPRGWLALPGGDITAGDGRRLQLFYAIPVPLERQGRLGPDRVSFSASAPQALEGALIGVSGVDQDEPVDVAAGAPAAAASAEVTAPSIAPAAATTTLLFVGATGSPQTWTAPAGMTPIGSARAVSAIGVARQWWRTATATGTRTATISSPAAGIGALVALKVPRPTTCPKLRILNRRRGGNLRFEADADGVISVRLKCNWSRRCVGALGLMSPTPIAAGSISVPAGRTRTVRIGLCRRTVRCRGSVPRLRGGRHRVLVQILLRAPNGQLVAATHRRDLGGLLVLP